MKNIIRAITGVGLLISGSILLGAYQDLPRQLLILGFLHAFIFIIGGILLLIGANTETQSTIENTSSIDEDE